MAKLDIEVVTKNIDKENTLAFFNLNGTLRRATSQELSKKMEEFFSQNVNQYIFRMNDVLLIDSSGMEFLVDLVDQGEEIGACFFISGLHPRIETIFRSLGLDTLFKFVESHKEALEKISKSIQPKEEKVEIQLSDEDEKFIKAIAESVERGKYELPILPDMALKLSNIIASPRGSANEIEKLIGTDQSVSTQVLKIANSALYGGRFQISSLKNAVVRLGMRKIRSVVFAITMRATILKGKKIDIIARSLWRHSITCAMLTEELVKKFRTKGVDKGELFTAALLHDIHKVVILASCRDACKKMEGYFPRQEILDFIYKTHFDKIFAEISKKWKLPETIVENIISMSNMQDRISKSTAVVSLCNKMTKIMEKRMDQFEADREFAALEITDESFEESEILSYAKSLYDQIKKSW